MLRTAALLGVVAVAAALPFKKLQDAAAQDHERMRFLVVERGQADDLARAGYDVRVANDEWVLLAEHRLVKRELEQRGYGRGQILPIATRVPPRKFELWLLEYIDGCGQPVAEWSRSIQEHTAHRRDIEVLHISNFRFLLEVPIEGFPVDWRNAVPSTTSRLKRVPDKALALSPEL